MFCPPYARVRRSSLPQRPDPCVESPRPYFKPTTAPHYPLYSHTEPHPPTTPKSPCFHNQPCRLPAVDPSELRREPRAIPSLHCTGGAGAASFSCNVLKKSQINHQTKSSTKPSMRQSQGYLVTSLMNWTEENFTKISHFPRKFLF